MILLEIYYPINIKIHYLIDCFIEKGYLQKIGFASNSIELKWIMT